MPSVPRNAASDKNVELMNAFNRLPDRQTPAATDTTPASAGKPPGGGTRPASFAAQQAPDVLAAIGALGKSKRDIALEEAAMLKDLTTKMTLLNRAADYEAWEKGRKDYETIRAQTAREYDGNGFGGIAAIFGRNMQRAIEQGYTDPVAGLPKADDKLRKQHGEKEERDLSKFMRMMTMRGQDAADQNAYNNALHDAEIKRLKASGIPHETALDIARTQHDMDVKNKTLEIQRLAATRNNELEIYNAAVNNPALREVLGARRGGGGKETSISDGFKLQEHANGVIDKVMTTRMPNNPNGVTRAMERPDVQQAINAYRTAVGLARSTSELPELEARFRSALDRIKW